MKANEAPEKIWVHELSAKELNVPMKEYHVEYIRADAFIEKACEWIEKNMDDYIHVEYDTATGKPTNEAHIAHKIVVEDFRKYMEGE